MSSDSSSSSSEASGDDNQSQKYDDESKQENEKIDIVSNEISKFTPKYANKSNTNSIN